MLRYALNTRNLSSQAKTVKIPGGMRSPKTVLSKFSVLPLHSYHLAPLKSPLSTSKFAQSAKLKLVTKRLDMDAIELRIDDLAQEATLKELTEQFTDLNLTENLTERLFSSFRLFVS